LLETGDAEEALAQAALLRALDPASSAAATIEADSLMALGRADEAWPLIRSASEMSNAVAWRRLASCAIEAKRTNELESLLSEPPEDIAPFEVRLLRARGLTAQGNRQQAAGLLEAALVEHPGAAELWLALADAQTDTESAGATLERAAQMAPGNAVICAALARWLRLQGRASEAYDVAQSALQDGSQDAEASYEAGAALLDLGRPADALEPLRLTHRRRPGDYDVRLALAAAFEGVGDLESASALVGNVPQGAPAAMWFTSGRLALAGATRSDPQQAKEAASKLLRARSLGSHESTLDFWLGVSLENAHEPQRAARAFGDFLAAGPREPSKATIAALRKAHCLLEAGETVEAVRDFEALRKVNGNDPTILRPLAAAYLAASLTDEACQAADVVLQSHPDDLAALGVIRSVARITGDWLPASKAYRSAAEKAQTDPLLWIEAGEACLHAGEDEAAQLAVTRSLAGEPDLATRRRAALAFVELGDAAQAAAILKEVAVSSPDQPSVWIELADVCARTGDDQGQAEALARAAALDPSDAEVHARLAVALSRLGRIAESVDAWRRARELSPDDPRVHGGLARTLLLTGAVEDGLDEFSRALQLHPTDARLRLEAGLASLHYGSATEAVDLLLPVSSSTPFGPEALIGLGEAWLRLRQPDRAEQALRLGCASPSAGPAGWALLAEACLSTGDYSSAKDAISQARRLETSDADERIAVARAEMRMGNWKDALTALTPVLLTKDPSAEAALAGPFSGSRGAGSTARPARPAITRVERPAWRQPVSWLNPLPGHGGAPGATCPRARMAVQAGGGDEECRDAVRARRSRSG
jgi:tetratricopeptide (TPR) repeat protein